MKTIYKYSIEPGYPFILELPIDSQILTIQVQNNEPKLWALVDTNLEKEIRRLWILGTGERVPPEAKTYIGTFQVQEDNLLVFHVFEEK
jgi:hypothetical protein